MNTKLTWTKPEVNVLAIRDARNSNKKANNDQTTHQGAAKS